jgi:hypothetical protein
MLQLDQQCVLPGFGDRRVQREAPKLGLGRAWFMLTVFPDAVRITLAEKGTVNVVPSGSW